MTFQYASDLHLEFPDNKEFLLSNPLKPVADTLLIAGDLLCFAGMESHNDFFDFLSDNFQNTYWIPGNHEYYRFDASQKSGTLNEKIRSNVFLVNNISVRQGNVKLIFSTLWSKIKAEDAWYVERGMNDFKLIKFGDSWFSYKHFNQLHEECLGFLSSELEKKDAEKSIVITHHIPTLMNYPRRYKGDILNSAFAVELFDLIESAGPDYWIYGHHHNNVPEFEIGKTRLVTNQLGYVQMNENRSFSQNKCVIV